MEHEVGRPEGGDRAMGDSVSGTAGGPSRLRSFNPAQIADMEYRAWVAYYRREWLRLLVASVGLVHAGFGMDWLRTLHGAWLVLRAKQLWGPASHNEPNGARRWMRRLYGLVRLAYGEPQDVAQAARLEVDWWRAHRERQRTPTRTDSAGAGTAGAGPTGAGTAEARTAEAGTAEARTAGDEAGPPRDELVDALTRLYAFLYREPDPGFRRAPAPRARGMDISDEWVADGCRADSPLLPREHA